MRGGAEEEEVGEGREQGWRKGITVRGRRGLGSVWESVMKRKERSKAVSMRVSWMNHAHFLRLFSVIVASSSILFLSFFLSSSSCSRFPSSSSISGSSPSPSRGVSLHRFAHHCATPSFIRSVMASFSQLLTAAQKAFIGMYGCQSSNKFYYR